MFIINSYDIYISIKLILSIYIAWTSIEENKLSLIVVSFMIIYIIVIFLKGILENNKFYFKILSLIEGILVLLFSAKYIQAAILMFSVLVAEYFIKEKKSIFILSFSIVPILFILNNNNLKNIFIILGLILILIFNNENKNSKIKNIDLTQEEQRKVIYGLQKKILEDKNIQEQILHTARLEERNNISSRLHDKIGHTISGTLLQLEAIKIILDSDKVKGFLMLDTCINNLRNGMEEIRMTLRNIKPAEEELGINRVKKILDEKIKNTSIRGKVLYSGDLEKIDSKLWIIFIQAITELTTNSAKYSKAKLIIVNIEVLNRFIKLEVKDDGIGCKDIKKGIGLRNIEEKVSGINGKLIINNEDGFGVIILIPYLGDI
ncbi:sensor histidine kinase [uncultured Clostridium sp.]|uniref:sensor histidine kinase n=1 Tax=uncultured Clostridium sp. TaxID=59620 RepID=UPI00258F9FA8|nr:histidine kinase [uncultured Clostridium sp.]